MYEREREREMKGTRPSFHHFILKYPESPASSADRSSVTERKSKTTLVAPELNLYQIVVDHWASAGYKSKLFYF